MKTLFVFTLIFIIYSGLSAQDTTVSDPLKITGEIRARGELDGRDFSNKSYPPAYTTLRSRLAADKTINGMYRFYLQIQDSRIFGEERNLQTNTRNLDLHQGFISVSNIFDVPLSIQAGRFEMIYGTERFIGAGNWGYVGRSFDGVRAGYDFRTFKTDAFVITQGSSINQIYGFVPASYPVNPAFDPSFMIYGLWNTIPLMEKNTLDIFGYIESSTSRMDSINNDLFRFTAGASYNGTFDDVNIIAEGAYQGGNINTRTVQGEITSFKKKDISAFTASLQLRYLIKPVTIGIGADIISGTKPEDMSTDFNTYTMNLGTGHKFFGYMDYFTDMPVHTANLGVNDFYITFNFLESTGRLNLLLNVHHFMSNVESAEGFSIFGQELDIVANYTFVKGVSVQWGGSIFLPGGLMKKIWENSSYQRTDPGFWSYLMATFSI